MGKRGAENLGIACYTGKMNRSSEHGSILVVILVAVILFGALSYTIANMMRTGNADKIGEEKASLYADEILNYAQQLRRAIQNMRISNGCEDEDISFENSVVAGYTNGTNTDCQAFHADGGGLTYIAPSAQLLASLGSTPVFYGEHYFTGGVNAEDIGTTAHDLIYYLPYISRIICIQLNEKVGIDNPGGEPPVEGSHGWTTSNLKFTGDYAAGGVQLQRNGTMNGCFEGNGAGTTPPEDTYHFYQILIPR